MLVTRASGFVTFGWRSPLWPRIRPPCLCRVPGRESDDRRDPKRDQNFIRTALDPAGTTTFCPMGLGGPVPVTCQSDPSILLRVGWTSEPWLESKGRPTMQRGTSEPLWPTATGRGWRCRAAESILAEVHRLSVSLSWVGAEPPHALGPGTTDRTISRQESRVTTSSLEGVGARCRISQRCEVATIGDAVARGFNECRFCLPAHGDG
jgi:hypothetical protein